MKFTLPFLAVFLLPGLAPGSASAQVTVNQAALDQLSGIQPASMVAPAPKIHHIVPRPHQAPVKPSPILPVVAKPAAPVLPPPSLPTAAPALPVLNAPPAAKPAAPPVVAQPAVVHPTVPVAPAPKPAPAPLPAAQLHFAAGSSDLPGNAAAALKPICAAAASGGTVSIAAAAAADPSDRSSAMRLSMSRAFAVRDALTACGVPATHILPAAAAAAPGKDPDSTMVNLQK